ncbi:MAG: DUF5077 domain-containing protein, partial [Panacibacter sp.]
MKAFFFSISFFVFNGIATVCFAQYKVMVPGYTGYAVPAENDEITEMFSANKGLTNWTNMHQSIQYWGMVQKAGIIDISINVKSAAGAILEINVANKNFAINIAATKTFNLIHIGKVEVSDTGALVITLRCKKKNGKAIADIEYLQLNCSAENQVFFNNKERRNAASVHLMYPLPDSSKIVSFYNEVKIPKGS